MSIYLKPGFEEEAPIHTTSFIHQIEMNGKLTNMEDLLQIIGALDSNLQQVFKDLASSY